MESLQSIYELNPNAFIDPHVGYHINVARKSFGYQLYSVTIFHCAIALEEQLSGIYEIVTNQDESKLYEQKRLERMNLNHLIKWAKEEGIIDTESDTLNAIRFARNFFGHATRIMAAKTKKEIESGSLDNIIPNVMDHPEWFEEILKFHEATTGETIDRSKPAIGWLDHPETALSAYEEATRFVLKTENLLQPI